MDKKARAILFKTYWTAKGWKSVIETDPRDFEYAKAQGVMFDPVSFGLKALKAELSSLITKIGKEKIVNGFLSSLTNKRPDWRSAIGSYFNAKLILENKRQFYRADTFKYENEDLNVLNFERIKWGGVRHSDLLYNYLDLKLFDQEEVAKPTEEDIYIFKGILNCIDQSPPGEYPSKLRERLRGVIGISKDQRGVLMEILACCEILKPQSFDRPTTGRHDWQFVEFWRGEDKYDKELVREYFGAVLKTKVITNKVQAYTNPKRTLGQ